MNRPLTMSVETDGGAPHAVTTHVTPVASWSSRAGALAVDVLFGCVAVATMAMLARISPGQSWQWWLFTTLGGAMALTVLVNRWLLPARLGCTLGRALAGISVVTRNGTPVSAGRLVGRDIAHLLDTVPFLLGWLWPLWDHRGRTLADLLLGTEVRPVDVARRGLRKPVALGLLAMVTSSAAAAALSYCVEFRHDQGIDVARAQIAEQGPHIVEQLLNYGPSTLKDDFARARSLATDSYRPQLITQQDSVLKAPIVANQYWAVNSALTRITPDSATMLLAMQGERGTDPKSQRFITATVQVEFVNADGRWRVQDLTVLTRPKPTGGDR